MDYCDVFISCLDSHSDGTHSLQRIYCVTTCCYGKFPHLLLIGFTSIDYKYLICNNNAPTRMYMIGMLYKIVKYIVVKNI